MSLAPDFPFSGSPEEGLSALKSEKFGVVPKPPQAISLPNQRWAVWWVEESTVHGCGPPRHRGALDGSTAGHTWIPEGSSDRHVLHVTRGAQVRTKGVEWDSTQSVHSQHSGQRQRPCSPGCHCEILGPHIHPVPFWLSVS